MLRAVAFADAVDLSPTPPLIQALIAPVVISSLVAWAADEFVAARAVVTAADDPFESDTEHDDFLADLYASRRADVG